MGDTDSMVTGAMLQNALHELTMNMMLVSCDSVVLYANRAARAELDRGDRLRLQAGRLRCAIDSQTAALDRALLAARSGRRSMIELGTGAVVGVHSVIPLAHAVGPLNLALLLSGIRDPFDPVTLTLFAKVVGLTGSERDVLISLCHGLAARDIAVQREVCISTVRSQIGKIREKVGARTVAQLIRKMSTLPPVALA